MIVDNIQLHMARLAFGCRAIGTGDDLEQMALGTPKIDAPAAIVPVDLAGTAAVELRMEGDATCLDAGEGSVELGLADQKGEMPGPDIRRIDEVQGDAIGGAHRH